jgi:hypothetical protein
MHDRKNLVQVIGTMVDFVYSKTPDRTPVGALLVIPAAPGGREVKIALSFLNLAPEYIADLGANDQVEVHGSLSQFPEAPMVSVIEASWIYLLKPGDHDQTHPLKARIALGGVLRSKHRGRPHIKRK